MEPKNMMTPGRLWNGISLLILAGMMAGCGNAEPSFDANGAFEAEETIISAEASGTLTAFEVTEGMPLRAGQVVGAIDSTLLVLQKEQVEAKIHALLGKQPDIPVQLSVLKTRLRAAKREQERMQHLVSGQAAPARQLDDINATVHQLQQQIQAQKSSLQISSKGISREAAALQVQLEQLRYRLKKCRIVNPIDGTVLVTYVTAHELVTTGRPLYKIADLSSITLRVYITGNQLPQVRLGQTVTVWTDNGSGGYDRTQGRISWISDEAEFTPKSIQTKEERVNKVYAVKVRVPNPKGRFKIGMYGAVDFSDAKNQES